MTAGPEGGRFTADPYVPTSYEVGNITAVPVERPLVASVNAQVAGGKLTARFVADEARLVRRITVQASESTSAYVYVGEARPENLVSGTRTGQFDENDTSQPIFVPEGTPFLVQWQTGTGSALARIEYVEV